MKWWENLEKIPPMQGRGNLCIYVDIGKNGKIHTPAKISKSGTEGVQVAVERLLRFVKNVVSNGSVETIKRLKDVYGSLPNRVWKTGEIPEKYSDRFAKVLSHD